METVERLISVLSEFNIYDVMRLEEKYDVQYSALKRLYESLDRPNVFLCLIVLNAICSYQLNCTGEEFWSLFSKYFSLNASRLSEIMNIESIVGMYSDFLSSCRCSKRLLAQKMKRISKVKPLLAKVMEDPRIYAEDPKLLQVELSKYLGAKWNTKTIVFTVKMFNYGARISLGVRRALPQDIPIPVDYRLKRISQSLGVKGDVQEFWQELSNKTGIPPLHLDTLLWVGYRYAMEGKLTDDEKFNKLIEFLRGFLEAKTG